MNEISQLQIALISAGAALIGSVIGVLGSWLSIWLQRRVNLSGKVSIHTKLVYSKAVDHKPWGFYHGSNNEISFRIPVWVDICNTTQVPKIVRDLNFIAYNGKDELIAFTQIQGMNVNDEYISLDNEGAYTFVIPPNSACRYNLEFCLKKSEIEENNINFDKLVLRYFDEKSRIKQFLFSEAANPWVLGSLPINRKWITMDCEVKYRGN